MSKCFPHLTLSLEEVMNKHDGVCVIINRAYFGFLSLGSGLDSVGDTIAVAYETDDYEKWMRDSTCIWQISHAPEGYYFKNERDPGQELYLFRGADTDEGDYTIYGESEWHDDRKKRTQFDIMPIPVLHDGGPAAPISHYITVGDDSYYGRGFYLKSGVSKRESGSHQVYATLNQTGDYRDEWYFFAVP